MKLLYLLATQGDWGGLEKHVFEVASAMADRGHHVTVLCDESYRQRCPSSVNIEPFNWKASRNNPFLWLRLRRVINRLSADIIHAQADKPASVLGRSGWPSQSVAMATVHNVKSRYHAFLKLDALIVVSQMIADQIEHKNVTVVNNGSHQAALNAEKISKLKSWLEGKPKPVFLAVGRLVVAKGFDVLLRAWPDSAAATLVILGGGKQYDELQQIINNRGLSNVYLNGESSDVPEWMACADFLVISSRNEGGPYVMAEALTLGLPVISTRVGMVPEFLSDECMMPVENEKEMERLLRAAMDKSDDFKLKSAMAFGKAQEKLTIKAMMDGIERVYLSALER